MFVWYETHLFLEQLKTKLIVDPHNKQLIDTYTHFTKPGQYSIKEGLLYLKDILLIPTEEEIMQKLLSEFHNSPIGGHAGTTRTLARLKAQLYWIEMKEDVNTFVHKCLICQQAKTSNTLPVVLLQPVHIPQQVWEDIAMDFITSLPNYCGLYVIMVVIDRLTKIAHFFL